MLLFFRFHYIKVNPNTKLIPLPILLPELKIGMGKKKRGKKNRILIKHMKHGHDMVLLNQYAKTLHLISVKLCQEDLFNVLLPKILPSANMQCNAEILVS